MINKQEEWQVPLAVTDAKRDNRKIIFDSGLVKEALLYNIKKMEINLKESDNCGLNDN